MRKSQQQKDKNRVTPGVIVFNSSAQENQTSSLSQTYSSSTAKDLIKMVDEKIGGKKKKKKEVELLFVLFVGCFD